MTSSRSEASADPEVQIKSAAPPEIGVNLTTEPRFHLRGHRKLRRTLLGPTIVARLKSAALNPFNQNRERPHPSSVATPERPVLPATVRMKSASGSYMQDV